MRKLILGLALSLFCNAAFATSSTINPSIPATNSALSSAPIRGNFAAAYSDINNIYSTALFSVPVPSLSTLGGALSFAPVSHNFLTGLNTSGSLLSAQPGFTDISGIAQPAQGGLGFDASTAISGYMPIGNGTGFTLAPLTAGANITITNSSGGITIAATGGGGGGGTVTTTGSPVTGNLAFFSGATEITNGNLTGDITTNGGSATSLAIVNGNTGSFGSSTAIPNFTTNSKGLITAAGTSAVVAPAGTLTGSSLASGVTGSSLTGVGTITSGNWNATPIPILYGGTGQATNTAAFDSLAPTPVQGDILYYNGSHWVVLAPGTNGFFLQTQGTSANPIWAASGGGGSISVTAASAFAVVSPSPLLNTGTIDTGKQVKYATASVIMTTSGGL